MHLKNFFNKPSIQKTIILVIAVSITLSTAIIAVSSYFLSEHIIQRKILQYRNDITKEISNSLSTALKEVNSFTIFVCSNETVQSQIRQLNQTASSHRILELRRVLEKELINPTIANSYFSQLTIVTNSGQSVWISRPSPESLSDSSIRQKISDGQGSLCWITSRSDNDCRVIVGREIYNLGTQKSIGYLLLNFSNDHIQRIINKKMYFSDGNISVIDSSGVILASNHKDTIGQNYAYLLHVGGKFGFHISRSNRIYINAVSCPFVGKGLCKLCHSSLACSISRNQYTSKESCHGSHVYNLSISLLQHFFYLPSEP